MTRPAGDVVQHAGDATPSIASLLPIVFPPGVRERDAMPRRALQEGTCVTVASEDGQEKERTIGPMTSLLDLMLPSMLSMKRDAGPHVVIVRKPPGAFPFAIVMSPGTGKLRGSGKGRMGREDRADGCTGSGVESGGTEMGWDAGE